MWVRGLKLVFATLTWMLNMSHPMWVRGLKRVRGRIVRARELSHPMWVRGLKQFSKVVYTDRFRRTLCGCVD